MDEGTHEVCTHCTRAKHQGDRYFPVTPQPVEIVLPKNPKIMHGATLFRLPYASRLIWKASRLFISERMLLGSCDGPTKITFLLACHAATYGKVKNSDLRNVINLLWSGVITCLSLIYCTLFFLVFYFLFASADRSRHGRV